MILQRLAEYYDRISTDPRTAASLPKSGYSLQKMSFCVVLHKNGQEVQFESLLDDGPKKPVPRSLLVPGQGKPSGQGINPCFLWDNAAYMLGFKMDDPKPNRTGEAYEAFRRQHLELEQEIDSPAFSAACVFLREWSPGKALERIKELEQIVGSFGVFKIAGSLGFVHDEPAIAAFWSAREGRANTKAESRKSMCLVTGLIEPIAVLHEPKIKGVNGTQSAGALLVSFNGKAYESLGKEQGYNAPVGTITAFKYANALNYLLNRRDRRFALGDATVVFWAERPTPMEDIADAVWGDFSPPKPDAPPEDHKRAAEVRRFLSQVREGHAVGEAIHPDSNVGFYMLGLSPNASRISVRFWLQSTVGEMKDRLAQHIRDVDIVGLDPDRPLTLRGMVRATARLVKGEYDYGSISPRLAGEITRAFLAGHRYPTQLLAATLQRVTAEGVIDATRAAVLKAYLLREELTIMDPYLNKEHPEPSYHCGRLLAVLAFAQEQALKVVNSGVIRRTLGSVMSNPGLQLGRLQRAAEVGHIPKLERDLPAFVRDELKLINCALRDEVPLSLPPHKQAIFMLGFYQQLYYLDFIGAQVVEGRRVRTQQGEWVRSRGEARVAELLTKLGIKYIYEPRAELKSGTERWPDFVVRGVKRRDDTFIEYLGMDTKEYNVRWNQKLQAYHDSGINEAGDVMGTLIVLDARKKLLDHIAMLDLLRPLLDVTEETIQQLNLNSEGDSK